ncbi:RNA deprotection pyrophosphohydrolase [Macrococcus psychrotolerans]|uniref:Nucleoside triphosphatase YtkD n=1 Tax=Macrococcus psychrotolerans TaxID=3039389 RepID=A0AAU6RL98_9STAP|nr:MULTISPECIES: nucleoside triphosphatase YtkD [Macrococcus]QYA32405.1 nucleoside triphosphatase YtkD [Macrococcus sp. 19Msa1099]QYA37212.1 nucleoside triphosphatase YtkD [Macrococcus caseolyticus]QYA75920.1 nucleoside triphosphatase YtkD [Macrococcus caseolyticus]
MEFHDHAGNKVLLTLNDQPDSDNKHVLIITNYNGKYLLTHNKFRGVEFPGGKVEQEETSLEAAKRELYEETGGIIDTIRYIGTYTVYAGKPFKKDVYYAQIKHIEEQDDYMETNGPVIVAKLDEVAESDKSFILKDDCVNYIVGVLQKDGEYDVQ